MPDPRLYPFKEAKAPVYVALCGAPKAGKSTVAGLLERRYGALIVDDGRPLREACKALYGLSEEDVTTHAGKERQMTVCGQSYTVRQLLGDLGRSLESLYGEFYLPELAVGKAWSHPEVEKIPFFVFPSVRMNQGNYYRSCGNTWVIEVTRPGFEPVNDFDLYNRAIRTHTIKNLAIENWQTEVELQVADIFDPIFQRQ